MHPNIAQWYCITPKADALEEKKINTDFQSKNFSTVSSEDWNNYFNMIKENKCQNENLFQMKISLNHKDKKIKMLWCKQ